MKYCDKRRILLATKSRARDTLVTRKEVQRIMPSKYGNQTIGDFVRKQCVPRAKLASAVKPKPRVAREPKSKKPTRPR